MKKGFTLVEILIVMTIIGILTAIVVPRYKSAIISAKEGVLKENLFQINDAIDKYLYDKGQYPTSLEDLIGKYLRKIPMDPFAKKAEWDLIHFKPEDPEEFDPDMAEGIIGVRSLSQKTSLDGTKYSEW
jgi:general secretion pathway protein G